MSRVSCTVLLGLALGCGSPALAAPVGAGSVSFSQIDFTFQGLPDSINSQYGWFGVDAAALQAETGMSSGFLNVYTPSSGWVVQNMPVLPGMQGGGLPGVGQLFNLGSAAVDRAGNALDTLFIDAVIDFSPVPTAAFAPAVAPSTFGVGAFDYNAAGKGVGPGLGFVPTFDSLLPPAIAWGGGVTTGVFQPFHPSIEQEVNQCGPAAVANSLQWLENQYPTVVTLPEPHIPGSHGDGSLVGRLDDLMKRGVGLPVQDPDFFKGKLEYIATTGNLKNRIVTKHWAGVDAFTQGDITHMGITSRDASDDGGTLIDWIISELEDGEDVEFSMLWDTGGGHWVELVGAGKTLGIPWVMWRHDAKQGAAGGTNWFDGGIMWSPLIDGRLVAMFSDGALFGRADSVMSQSIPTPGTLALLALAGLASRRRR